jgi:hypothetical protein
LVTCFFRVYPKEGTTAGALQHSYCERYEWILAARVVWGVFMWFGKGVVV